MGSRINSISTTYDCSCSFLLTLSHHSLIKNTFYQLVLFSVKYIYLFCKFPTMLDIINKTETLTGRTKYQYFSVDPRTRGRDPDTHRSLIWEVNSCVCRSCFVRDEFFPSHDGNWIICPMLPRINSPGRTLAYMAYSRTGWY